MEGRNLKEEVALLVLADEERWYAAPVADVLIDDPDGLSPQTVQALKLLVGRAESGVSLANDAEHLASLRERI